MAVNGHNPPRTPTPQSIPLQDLARPPDTSHSRQGSSGARRSFRSPRSSGDRRSILGRAASGLRYERIGEGSPPRGTNVPRIDVSIPGEDEDDSSPVDDLHGFAAATGSVGLSFDGSFDSEQPRTPEAQKTKPRILTTGSSEEATAMDNIASPQDTDRTPLRIQDLLDPTQVRSATTPTGQKHDRHQNRSSVHWVDGDTPGRNSTRSASRLGDDLPTLETGLGVKRKLSKSSGIGRLSSVSSYGNERSRSLSPGASPISRANSMLRMMSQRVVNLSNDTDMVEQSIRRKSSVRRPSTAEAFSRPSFSAEQEFPEDLEEDPMRHSKTGEKRPSFTQQEPPAYVHPPIYPNPLKGNSLGVFPADNWFRKWLCEVLVHPATEPIILILIVVQTVLLAVDSAPPVINDPRTKRWGTSKIDYALFALFVVYTLELTARTIVSGFVMNPSDFSTLDRSKGFWNGVYEKAQSFFAPQRQDLKNRDGMTAPVQPSILRSFTGLEDPTMPGHGRQQQRMRLARRSFLRHSFNRLDFIAVVSYWISFGLALANLEGDRHIYVFRMLSCLRILRLLGLTSGTSVILRSLKKAAPLLVNVTFLIAFFWLLFAIVGVQSFKSSLRRSCVWMSPEGLGNYTQDQAPGSWQTCGGHLDAMTNSPMPWLTTLGGNGTSSHKGYLCPQGSYCVEGSNPYQGTVSFDNIGQSLELVFVVVSSNTFSDLMYALTDSDYLAAALFFAATIVVMTFWLVNLLIAVITSSFQIIREESRRSAFTTEQIEEPALVDKDLSGTSHLKRLYARTYWFWIVVITFGLVVQCLRSSNMGPSRTNFINNTETVVTLILLVEILLRFSSNWRDFFYSKRNLVDLGLTLITAIIQIPPIRNSGQAYAWLSFFQIARIYRVVMSFRVTRDLIMVVFSNIVGLLNLIVFVFLLTFLTAILASQMFRGEIPQTDNSSNTIRIQFFDVWNSFIGMYQVFSSENWTTLLYNVTQYDVQWDTAWLGAIFFIMWFVFANLIVLNMFIAVIQESFDVSEDEKRLQQVKQFLEQRELSAASTGTLSLAAILRVGRQSLRARDALDYGPASLEMLLKDAVVKEFLDDEDDLPMSRKPTEMPVPNAPVVSVNPGIFSQLWTKAAGLHGRREVNPFYSQRSVPRADEDFDPRARAKEIVSAAEQRKRLQRQYLAQHPRYNVSLFIFGPENPIRIFCQRLVGPGRGDQRAEGVDPWKPAWYAVSAFIYCAIVAMVLLACVTTPLYQREYFAVHIEGKAGWFTWIDLGFAILFTIEAVIKVIADGFFFTPNAYYRGIWGFIDGVVLITLWINVVTSLYRDDGVSRAVGAFKALRALRLLNVSDSARNTFHSIIILGGWKVISAAFVSISLLIPFAMLGVNIFNGQMESCNDNGYPGGLNLSNCVGEFNSTPFNWTVLAPREVSNPYYSFDNFGSALFILFQVVSQEGWTDVMWSGMSTTGKGSQPNDFAAQGNAVYFIIFNLLGAVFVLTLFVSVFMRNYTEQTGVAFLTADQRSWLELRKLLKQVSPSKRSLYARSQTWQKWCYRMATQKHGPWQRFITGVLLLHLTLLIIEYYPGDDFWARVRDYVFLGLTCIYIFNIFVRIIGLSWPRFRRSSWDIFSLLAVGGTLATTLMALSNYTNRAFDQLYKLFLVSIAFLLIPRNNSLDQLFKTAAASLTSIGNLLATWFVLFLVYAIAFTQTLGLTRFGGKENNNLNFRNVPKALILLFRMSCGEGWNQIMEDYATIEEPFCTIDRDDFFNSDCGSATWARLLFISWNIISMYIFVSLFVSLIFESFSYVYQRSSGAAAISREEVRRFKQAWSEFDPGGIGYISKGTFPRLLAVSTSSSLTT